MPVAIVMIGATSALAGNLGKGSDKAIVNGFAFHNAEPVVKCIDSNVSCSTTGSVTCMANLGSGPEQLYEKIDDTSCPNPLFVRP